MENQDYGDWRPEAIRRICVLRPLQLGDLICATPALRALRHGFPQAHIDLIGLPWAREFVDRCSHLVDGFIAFPGYPGLPEREPDLRRLPGFFADVQSLEYDLAVQLHGSGGITNPITAMLGARRMACFVKHGDWRPEQALAIPYPEDRHEVHRLLALVEALGAPGEGDEVEFPVTHGDRLELAMALEGRDLPQPFAVVHAGSRALERRWPIERFAAVADGLARMGVGVVLTGTNEEAALVQSLEAAMRAPATNLCGRTSIGALTALIARAGLLVSNDTGVSHIAAGVGTPSVVIFLTSEPARWAPLDGRIHRVVEPSLTLGGPHAELVLAEAESLLRVEAPVAAG